MPSLVWYREGRGARTGDMRTTEITSHRVPHPSWRETQGPGWGQEAKALSLAAGLEVGAGNDP